MISKKVAIDLGTANSMVFVEGQGIVLSEPTVVAITLDDNEVVAVGNEAKQMLGRTPLGIFASKPLKYGVIADYATTEAMLKYFVRKSLGRTRLVKPEIMVSVPSGVTSVESRAVLDATYAAGARRAYLIPEPLAASIGAKIPISEASGSMIVNLGGGTTEVAVISLGGLVVFKSIRVAGTSLDEAIASHLRRKYNLLVGERTAELLKIEIGSATFLEQELVTEVKGRGSIVGLPKVVEITSTELTKVIQGPLNTVVEGIKSVLEQTPPELSSDIIDKGMVLSGGTSLLRNLDKLLAREIGVPCHRADDPIHCVVNGAGIAIQSIGLFRKSLTIR